MAFYHLDIVFQQNADFRFQVVMQNDDGSPMTFTTPEVVLKDYTDQADLPVTPTIDSDGTVGRIGWTIGEDDVNKIVVPARLPEVLQDGTPVIPVGFYHIKADADIWYIGRLLIEKDI